MRLERGAAWLKSVVVYFIGAAVGRMALGFFGMTPVHAYWWGGLLGIICTAVADAWEDA